jgi:hypothetical protein
MSADLMGMLKLVHHVTGFLIRLSPQQLTGLADGRLTLAVDRPLPEARQPLVPATLPAQRADPPARPGDVGPPASAAEAPKADFAEIAGTLRQHESIDAGLAYLDGFRAGGKKLAKADLLAIGRELQLTLPASITAANAKRKLLEHAIGARKKYAGLAP